MQIFTKTTTLTVDGHHRKCKGQDPGQEIAPDQQKLILAGKQWEDGCSLTTTFKRSPPCTCAEVCHGAKKRGLTSSQEEEKGIRERALSWLSRNTIKWMERAVIHCCQEGPSDERGTGVLWSIHFDRHCCVLTDCFSYPKASNM